MRIKLREDLLDDKFDEVNGNLGASVGSLEALVNSLEDVSAPYSVGLSPADCDTIEDCYDTLHRIYVKQNMRRSGKLRI